MLGEEVGRKVWVLQGLVQVLCILTAKQQPRKSMERSGLIRSETHETHEKETTTLVQGSDDHNWTRQCSEKGSVEDGMGLAWMEDCVR